MQLYEVLKILVANATFCCNDSIGQNLKQSHLIFHLRGIVDNLPLCNLKTWQSNWPLSLCICALTIFILKEITQLLPLAIHLMTVLTWAQQSPACSSCWPWEPSLVLDLINNSWRKLLMVMKPQVGKGNQVTFCITSVSYCWSFRNENSKDSLFFCDISLTRISENGDWSLPWLYLIKHWCINYEVKRLIAAILFYMLDLSLHIADNLFLMFSVT